MKISRKLLFRICKAVEVIAVDELHEHEPYNDFCYDEYWTLVLSDDLKLPDDFNEDTDLPTYISRGISRILRDDENFILEIIESYKDYIKDNSALKKFGKSYTTSHGDICITEQTMQDELFDKKLFLCFPEEIEDENRIRVRKYIRLY